MQIQKYQSARWVKFLLAVPGLVLLALGSKSINTFALFDTVATGLFVGGGTMVIMGLIFALPAANSLEIVEEGFSYRAGLRRVFCRWEQCSEFSSTDKSMFGMVAGETVTFESNNRSNLAGGAGGLTTSLPGTYGLQASELAAQLNRYRDMQLKRLEKPTLTFL